MKNTHQEDSITLLDIVDLNFLQSLLDSFANSINMANMAFDDNGPLTQPSNFCNFCTNYIRKSSLIEKCDECNLRWAKIAAEECKPIIYTCHMGLSVFAVPIIVEDRHIASIVGGQVFTMPPDLEYHKKAAKDLGICEDEYINELQKIKIFSTEQIESAAQLLYVVANAISEIAHKNYELLEKNKKEHLSRQIMETIRSSFDVDFIKHTMVFQLGYLLKADRVAFADYDIEKGNYYTLAENEYRSSSSVKTFIGYDFAATPGFIEAIREIHLAGKDIIFNDLDKHLEENNLKNTGIEDFYRKMGFMSSMAINISHRGFFYGDLVITFEQKRNITESDINFIRNFADQVGIAIYQAKIIEEKKQTAENEKVLRQIMLSSSGTFNFEEIIKSTVTSAGTLLNADRCFFVETDIEADSNLPIKEYAEYISSPNIKSHTQRIPEKSETSIFVELSKIQKTIAVNDIEEIDLPEATRKMLIDDLSVKSYLIVSVKYGETVYGAMVLHYVNNKKEFNQNDISILEAIANQSAIIINQAKLYEKMKKTIERETILRRIIEITRSSLDIHKVKQQVVEELGKAFHADRCYFRAYDKSQDKFFAPDVEYLSSPDIGSLLNVEPNQEGLKYFSEELRKRSQGFYPVVANEEFAKGTPVESYMNQSDIKADYAMPIIDREDGFTWLVLHYSYEDPKFDDDQKKLLETIAFQIDTALSQIKFYHTSKQQAEREKAILSNLPFMVWLKDTKGVLLAANEPYAKMCNTTVSNLIGKTDYDLFPKENADIYVEDDRKVMEQKKTVFTEEMISGPDGPRWHETYKTPLIDSNGEVVGTTGFSRDITERKEIDRMKNEFVSMVSHELRTPLTSIRGALGLVTSGKIEALSDKTKGLLDIANNNCLRLINLINDILDIEKIEAGKMDFEIETLELMSLVEQSIQSNIQFAQKFGVGLKLENTLEKILIRVDSNRLIQVLTNLLSNAIKFSKANANVKVSVTDLNKYVRVSVTNYGSEIPKEFKNRIFQKFAQADSSDTRKKGGTGLGLSISKAIIEKMGGHINFTSENNETTFYFDLPEFVEEKPFIEERLNQQRPNILICEDDKDIALLIRMLLNQENYSADIAYNANQTKQLLEERNYDALLLDLILPDEDGLSLIKELRGNIKTENIPIIVVSVKAKEGERELNGHFAVFDWIDKPIKKDRLLSALNCVISTKTISKPKILHIEDDADVRKVTYSILKDDACVSQVSTLNDAKNVLSSESFDLLLIDLELPDGNGAELLPLIKNKGNDEIITVIFSAHNVNNDIAKQVDAVLLKSNTSNEDLLKIVNLIKQKKCSTGPEFSI